MRGVKMDKMEEDLRRKVTARLEKAIRYLRQILLFGDARVLAEEHRLNDLIAGRRAVYSEEGGVPQAVETDEQYVWAQEQLALLHRYGGLRQALPSVIAAATAEIRTEVLHNAAVLAEKNAEREKRMGVMVGALLAAATPKDMSQPRIRRGGVGRVLAEMVCTIEQRLGHLIDHAPTPAIAARARETVQRLGRLIASGETAYTLKMDEYRQQWVDAVEGAVRRRGVAAYTAYMAHLESPINAEISRAVSQQGFGGTMTYGQALQLYVSLTQKGYARNVVRHGRAGQVALLEKALTWEDMRLALALRKTYEARREELSEVVLRVTGLPVARPDANYMPVQMMVGSRGGFGADGVVRQWNPFAASLTPRVRHRRDFDERVTIQGMFRQRAEDTARAIAWGERGIEIRGVLGQKVWQDTVERYYGKEELHALLKQVNDALMGVMPRNDGVMDYGARYLRRINTYTSLSGNLLSASRQLASFPMFAVTLDGGYRELIGCIRDFDFATLREVMGSAEYRARYRGGIMPELSELREERGWHTIGALIRACYQAGMKPMEVCDFVPTALVGTGLYKHLLARKIAQGMPMAEAKREAMGDMWIEVESTQQSSRASKMPDWYRNASETQKLFLQFASAPVLQLSHEVHYLREMRAGVPGARGRFIRAVLTNHVVVPVLMTALEALFNGLVLARRPEDDREWWEEVEGALARNVLLGPISRIFIWGAVADSLYDGIVRGRVRWGGGHTVPADSLFRVIGYGGLAIRDLIMVDTESLHRHLMRMLDGLSPAARHIRQAVENRLPA